MTGRPYTQARSTVSPDTHCSLTVGQLETACGWHPSQSGELVHGDTVVTPIAGPTDSRRPTPPARICGCPPRWSSSDTKLAA
ncbi:hypothetical protein FAIPA1_50074 [Frankia sp. AiPs1]